MNRIPSPEASVPPAGPPWDLSVAEAPLAFLDLEMTGLDPSRDRVVEICIHRVVNGALEGRLSSLVLPEDRVGGASHVHGLDAAALAGAPPFSELVPAVTKLLDGAILVAHAAEWDVKFLVMELERAGTPSAFPFALDTLVMARRSFALRSYSLDALALALQIDRGQAHRAEPDVLAMRGVFARCLEVLAPVSVRDLWEVRVAEKRARAHVVAACEAAVEHAVPVVVTYRPSRRAPEPLTMVLTAVEHDREPPHVTGYDVLSRGRRELRADRILKVEAVPALPTGA